MKLITLNTWQGRIVRNLVPFFQEQQADIICLQEIYSSSEPVTNWLDTFHMLETLQDVSGLEHQYFSPTFSHDIMGVEVAYGNAILSRYALSNQQTLFTHGEYKKLATAHDEVQNTRNAQIVNVQSPSGDVTIVNTHAHWDKNPNGSELSLQRLEKLAEALEDIQSPMIIAGDFNLNRETEAIQTFSKALKLTDLSEQNGITNTLNNLVTPFKVACDYVFINDSIAATNLQLSEALLSDHKALILDFDIKS